MLTLDNVTKQLGQALALGPIELSFEPASTTALIGPSGCGKSTLLRLMIGLIEPDSGTVRFDGEAVSPVSAERIRQRMGYVIQDGGLFPHLSARDNVALMADYLGQASAHIDQRIAELAELVRLNESALARPPTALSGGQRQRVALMRALMLDPVALLLDEPLGALDPMIRAELQEDLARIFRDLGKTVVLVTHDLAEAAFFADRIVLLQDGNIVQQGSPHELLEQPTNDFVRAFVSAQRGLHLGGGTV